MLFSGIFCTLAGITNLVVGLVVGQSNFNFVIGGMCLGVGLMDIIDHCVKNR